MKVLFLVPYPVQGASTRHRVLQFLPYLRKHGITSEVRSFISTRLYAVKNEKGMLVSIKKVLLLFAACVRRIWDILSCWRYDLVFIQREAFPFFTPVMEKLVHVLNPNIIYDFDDAIFTAPTHGANWRDALRNPKRMEDVVALSSLVVAGSKYLAAYAEQFNQNVEIMPTVLDTVRYRVRRHMDTPTVTIGWIGSWSTLGSLRLLDQVFQSLAERYDIRVKVVGARNVFSFQPRGVVVEPKLWHKGDELADLQSFDIGVMPLPDNQWERGKCGFKVLQYMAVGVPPVASPVGVNAEMIEDGGTGFLASTTEEWLTKLGWLIEDWHLRERIGMHARRVVETRYSLESTAPRFAALFCRVAMK